ncbi:MAG: GIY-YIG nuclease family protein [Deltaproteobacteria bacterium]|nr:GIY-YIG nuclease family protein [Deltaproteobacteria bacterium]
MSSQPGTYALILRASRGRVIQVGQLALLTIRQGSYVYVGSAFGPGGLRGRVRHHLRLARRPHWHVDYLRRILRLNEVWYSHDPRRREHLWAALLRETPGCSVPARRFGASDCQCESHLFFFDSPPSIDAFRRRLHEAAHGHSPVRRARRIHIGWKTDGKKFCR